MRVEIVTDLVCPWCYIGKRRFDAAVQRLGTDGVTLDLQVSYRAFQLDPRAPVDEPTPVRDAYAAKFGSLDRADKILAEVTQAAAQTGIEFRMQHALRANTMRAHRLLKIVATRAPALVTVTNESVMRAYFSEGRDIGDTATLLACARRAGLGTDLADDESLAAEIASTTPDSISAAIAADFAWNQAHDVTAVPTFVVNEALSIPGARDTDTFVRLLGRIAAQ
jgi:predicted DsbA family dithiol-disulfide isomerase